MLKRNYCFLVVLLILFLQQGNGQQIPDAKEVQPPFIFTPAFKGLNAGVLILSPDYHTKKLSFFCNQEYRFEKATSIPFRFRLGSLEYTDYLEKKPNAILPKKY